MPPGEAHPTPGPKNEGGITTELALQTAKPSAQLNKHLVIHCLPGKAGAPQDPATDHGIHTSFDVEKRLPKGPLHQHHVLKTAGAGVSGIHTEIHEVKWHDAWDLLQHHSLTHPRRGRGDRGSALIAGICMRGGAASLFSSLEPV